MAAETQELPPWMTLSSSVLTNADGEPTSTSFTTLQLPLTYYGPSIPLGTDWIYGGLTSPASTSTSPSVTTTQTASAIPTTSAIPTSTTSPTFSLSTATATSPSSSITSSSSSSSSPASSSSSTSSAVAASPTSSSNSNSSRHHNIVLIGAILGSILGSLFLLFLFLLFRYRRRRLARSGRRTDDPLWMWQHVERPPPDSPTSPMSPGGEGVPRESGGERDSFLRRSEGARDGMQEMNSTARLVGTGAALGIAAAGKSSDEKGGERDRKSSGESGYASAEGGPGEGERNSGSTHRTNPSRHIIPPDVLIRMYSDDGHHTDEDDHEPQQDSPLLPPRALDPDGLVGLGVRPSPAHKPSQLSLLSERSVTPGNDPEAATVQTARRVRLEDMQRAQPRALSPIEDTSSREGEAGPSAWTRVVGLANLSRRLSWLSRSPSPPLTSTRSRSRPPSAIRPTSYAGRSLTDRELENGRGGGVGGPLLRAEMGYREGSRPISTGTGSSGNRSGGSNPTVYHDASSRPQTPAAPVPAVTMSSAGSRPSAGGRSGSSTGNTVFHDALSRPGTPYRPGTPAAVAYSSVGSTRPTATQLSTSHLPVDDDPPAYSPVQGAAGSVYATPVGEFPPTPAATRPAGDIDILDTPAPAPEPAFIGATGSSSVANRPTAPPGLLAVPQVWANASSPSVSGAETSGGEGSRESPDSGMVVRFGGDVLEEEPPSAGEGWRTLSRLAVQQGSGSGRRATFGMSPTVIHPRDVTSSEHASLHSMRSASHLTAHSPLRSSGSSPSSHQQNTSSGTTTTNTHSSPHSHSGNSHSRFQTGSSGVSLTYSNSISEDGRRRPRHEPGEISPPISAVGRSSMIQHYLPTGSGSPRASVANPSPVPPSPTRAHSPPAPSLNPFGFPQTQNENQTQSDTVASRDTQQTSSSVTTHTSVTDPTTGQVMRFPSVPWTGGLGTGMGPGMGMGRISEYGDENSSLGGSWGSPAHLRGLREGRNGAGSGGDGGQSYT